MVTKILIIEDEDETRDIFLRCLAFENFSAMGAKDGETGVKLAAQYQPDLIVCDIMMPRLDGYGVLTAIRTQQIASAIPFIFLTAKVTMADLRQGMGLGADDYLTKPCTVEQFLEAIAARLQRHKEIQKNAQAPAPSARTSIFPNCPKLAPAFQFIDTHYRQSIYLDDVAQAAGYSPAYLTHLCQNHTGRTVKQWITQRRMTKAHQLLKSTAYSIRQVAEETGYADAGYFTRQFRKLYGLTPKAWREQLTPQSVTIVTKQTNSVTTATKQA